MAETTPTTLYSEKKISALKYIISVGGDCVDWKAPEIVRYAIEKYADPDFFGTTHPKVSKKYLETSRVEQGIPRR